MQNDRVCTARRFSQIMFSVKIPQEIRESRIVYDLLNNVQKYRP